jgi:MFS transporter, putative metabolite:H+ symporter
MCLIHLNLKGISLNTLYVFYVILGLSAGYWATLITMAAENFGTNLRATVATSIPNFARASAVPISIFYQFLNGILEKNLILSAMIVGLLCFGLGFWGNASLKESFAKDLDFVE